MQPRIERFTVGGAALFTMVGVDWPRVLYPHSNVSFKVHIPSLNLTPVHSSKSVGQLLPEILHLLDKILFWGQIYFYLTVHVAAQLPAKSSRRNSDINLTFTCCNIYRQKTLRESTANGGPSSYNEYDQEQHQQFQDSPANITDAQIILC